MRAKRQKENCRRNEAPEAVPTHRFQAGYRLRVIGCVLSLAFGFLMHRSFHKIFFCLTCAVMMPSASGDELPETLRKPPVSPVMDAGGVFRRDAAALERMRGKIRQLEKDHGYRMYVVVEPVFISTTAPELAASLQEAWLPDGNGVVIVYESDSRILGLGRDVGEEPDAAVTEALVPTHETAALLRQAVDLTDTGLAPTAFLETLVDHLTRGFDRYFERRATPPPPGRSLRFALLAIGGLALLALGGIAVAALTRMQSVSGGRSFRFPSADQPERLGAPSGGKVVSRSFKQRD